MIDRIYLPSNQPISSRTVSISTVDEGGNYKFIIKALGASVIKYPLYCRNMILSVVSSERGTIRELRKEEVLWKLRCMYGNHVIYNALMFIPDQL